jgi:hypothetical protein
VSEAGSDPPDETLALTGDEKRAVIALLKRTLAEARFAYSPQLDPLKAILAKLVPPAPRPPLRAAMAGSADGELLHRPTDDIGCCRIGSLRERQHQIEPDPAAMAERYRADLSVPDWHKRLVCGQCGGRRIDFVVTGAKP